MEKARVTKFVEYYLDAIGMEGFISEEIVDEMGLVIQIKIPRKNESKIGILKGKKNANLAALIRLTQVIGLLDGKKPLLLFKLID